MGKSNVELAADNEKLSKELESLRSQLVQAASAIKLVTEQRDEVAKQLDELQSAPKVTSATDGHNVDKAELRMLTAFCLASTKDPSGRAHNMPTIEKEAPNLVGVAVKLATEIVSQIP